ncbi:Hypothetical protein I596_2826 [Dokdonella koreensis DS-123]|uniref:Uncharacterized protein n=1 Tax=Dokdonella koreensis DS-123 TaxID=1300342 RepID=A0A160DWZ8_9GAMM|nr:Hypothetical protein I596_2826 [Dokdonella koreensis DS-123]
MPAHSPARGRGVVPSSGRRHQWRIGRNPLQCENRRAL